MMIGIIGSGNVGKACGKALSKHGYDVGFYDISVKQLEPLIQEGYFATTNIGYIASCDVLFICVPTEALPNGDCDMSIYGGVIDSLKANNYKGLVVQMSTCPPLSARKYSEILHNYVVCPSHYQMSRMVDDAMHPVRVNIGTVDGKPDTIMAEIFSKFDGPIFFMSYEMAELTKYVENVLAASVISYWNEVYMICEKMKGLGWDVDSNKMARMVNVAPCWRSVYRFHGKAFGGLCLPKDTKAFINWCFNNLAYRHQFAMSSDSINNIMKEDYGVNEQHSSYGV